MDKKKLARIARHKRIRKRLTGTSSRPRLSVFRSLKNIYAQIIDDEQHKTLLSLSTIDKALKKDVPYGGNINAAKKMGEEVAKLALKNNIKQVVFDRGGYTYHGKLKAFAESLQASGLILSTKKKRDKKDKEKKDK